MLAVVSQLMEIPQPNGAMIVVENEKRGLFIEFWATDKIQIALAEIRFEGGKFVLKQLW